jgi:hypothetical protein
MNEDLGSGKSLVTQTGNTAGGHIAGKDVIDVHGDYVNYTPAPVPESKLGQLYQRLKAEARDDAQLSDYISQLEIFTRVVKDEEVVGLDGKLNAAERIDQLDMAMAMKERIYAQLRENMFSKTFQTIYAIIMSKIWEEFTTHVRPAISAGASKQEVDMLINKHVVKPIAAELDTCAEYDGVATTDVRGMLYFLTGNCHLLWH